MKNINLKIFELVDAVKKKNKSNSQRKNKKELIGIPVTINLGEVKGLKETRTDLLGNTIDSFVSSDDETLGIDEKGYIKLIEIVSTLIEQKPFANNTTFDFIENTLFDWIIETYKLKKARTEPIDYLKNQLEKETNKYVFYFKTVALGIEKSFKIGNAEFTYFTDNYIQREYQNFKKENPEKEKKEFDLVFDRFKNTPIVKVNSNGTFGKALQNAKKEVALTVDAIKCFLIDESIDKNNRLFDVDYRFLDIEHNTITYKNKNKTYGFEHYYSRNTGIVPTRLDDEKVKTLVNKGLGVVSSFLSNKKETELYFKIQSFINRIANYTSERNSIERVVKIISLYESIFIPTTEGRAKGLTIIKTKVLPKIINEKDLDYIIRLFIKFYDVRDKYLHNGIEKHIDLFELSKVQSITVFLLLKLIDLNNEFDNTNDVLRYFDIL